MERFSFPPQSISDLVYQQTTCKKATSTSLDDHISQALSQDANNQAFELDILQTTVVVNEEVQLGQHPLVDTLYPPNTPDNPVVSLENSIEPQIEKGILLWKWHWSWIRTAWSRNVQPA